MKKTVALGLIFVLVLMSCIALPSSFSFAPRISDITTQSDPHPPVLPKPQATPKVVGDKGLS